MPVCGVCNKDITGAYTTVNDKPLHSACFACALCNQQITGAYVNHEGKIYDEACYDKVRKRTICHGCPQEIKPGVEFFKAMDHDWHKNCFTCVMCDKDFIDKMHFSVWRDQPIHQECMADAEAGKRPKRLPAGWAEEYDKKEADERKKKEAEEEAKRKAEEDERKRKEEEERKKREAEEAERKRKEEEERKKREAEEAERKRKEEEDRLKREAEEAERKRKEEEERKRKEAEEAERKRKHDEEEAERKRKHEEDERLKAEEAKRKAAEDEARRKREAEEAERKRKEDEEKARKAKLPQCCACEQGIEGTQRVYKEYIFHIECFKCPGCQKQIEGDGPFPFHEKRLWHTPCVPRHDCGKCGKRVENEDVSALGKHWHPECFVCQKCGEKVSGSFGVVNGLPIHSACK